MVLVTTEFEKLAQTVLQSRAVPSSAAVVIGDNPEYLPETRMIEVTDGAAKLAIARLKEVIS